jgi:hypothetical protein
MLADISFPSLSPIPSTPILLQQNRRTDRGNIQFNLDPNPEVLSRIRKKHFISATLDYFVYERRQTHRYMNKELGMMPHSFISGNIFCSNFRCRVFAVCVPNTYLWPWQGWGAKRFRKLFLPVFLKRDAHKWFYIWTFILFYLWTGPTWWASPWPGSAYSLLLTSLASVCNTRGC